jgi:alpha-tubulin suppressor-like RCC1 family protein
MYTAQGRVFMLGENECQKMGVDGTFDNGKRTPALLEMKDEHGNQLFICDIGAGYHHSMFLAYFDQNQYQVWGCGSNSHHEIGDNIGSNLKPTHIKQYDDKDVIKIRCGYYSSVFITRNGKVACRGMRTPTPHDLEALDEEFIVEAASGYSYHIFMNAEGKCFVHGDNGTSQLGITGDRADTIKVLTPMIDKRVILGHGSYNHTVLITDDGELYTTGDTGYGRLGRNVGNKSAKGIGRVKRSIQGKPVRSASAGGYHTIISTWDGEAYACGHSSFGQLGTRLDDYDTNYLAKVDTSRWEIDNKPVYIIQACATGWGSFLLENSSRGLEIPIFKGIGKLYKQLKSEDNPFFDLDIKVM